MTKEARPSSGWKSEFRLFHEAIQRTTPGLLHFAAHSHHFWPDVTFAAQQQAWLDAASGVDDKWDAIFAELLPSVRGHIARILDLSDQDTLVFAPNTHELVVRLFSCLEASVEKPVRVLTSDGEFHSFRRQLERWEEAGLVEVTRIATQPFDSFEQRFYVVATSDHHDLVFLSQVLFDSGAINDRLEELAGVLAPETFLAIDAYHGFMALPTSWRELERRAFYLAGGYKYAMAGEGACFMHCPPDYGSRPLNTGWYAAFGSLQEPPSRDAVAYAEGGQRFSGATFDPSGLYRLEAAMQLWHDKGVEVRHIHRHVGDLQEQFLEGLEDFRRAGAETLIGVDDLLLPRAPKSPLGRAHFLTFALEDAARVHQELRARSVVTDIRGDRLRVGFGVYQEATDVEELLVRLRS